MKGRLCSFHASSFQFSKKTKPIEKKQGRSSLVRELVCRICAVLDTEAFDVSDLGELQKYACLLAEEKRTTDRALINDLRELLAMQHAARPADGGYLTTKKVDEFVNALIKAAHSSGEWTVD